MRVNGIHLNVEVVGEGEPLLLLHGFTGSLTTWEPFVESWRNRYCLIMVDIIGHGKSAKPREPARYTMELAVNDLVTLCDMLSIERCHMLGYSMGGRLALSFVVAHPDRVRSLVMIGSSPGIKDSTERHIRMKEDEQLAQKIEQEGIESFVNQWEQLPLFRTQKRLDPTVRQKIRQQRLNNSIIGLSNSLRGMGTGRQRQLWDDLPTVQCPTLLIVGEEDQKFCHIAERMVRLMPRATLRKVPLAGHAVHIEQPETFAQSVMTFLNTI